MARIYNGLQADIDRKICIIGVGALGSQIATIVFMPVSGNGLVDNDILWPHNTFATLIRIASVVLQKR